MSADHGPPGAVQGRADNITGRESRAGRASAASHSPALCPQRRPPDLHPRPRPCPSAHPTGPCPARGGTGRPPAVRWPPSSSATVPAGCLTTPGCVSGPDGSMLSAAVSGGGTNRGGRVIVRVTSPCPSGVLTADTTVHCQGASAGRGADAYLPPCGSSSGSLCTFGCLPLLTGQWAARPAALGG